MFFQHIGQRETTYGASQSFRFKAILSSRKQGALRPSRYADDPDDRDVSAVVEEERPRPKRRRKRQPQKQLPIGQTVLNFNETATTTVDSNTHSTSGRADSANIGTPESGNIGNAESTNIGITDSSPVSNNSATTSAIVATGLETPENTPTPDRAVAGPSRMGTRKSNRHKNVIPSVSQPKSKTSKPQKSNARKKSRKYIIDTT
jgi:hypothetical protein